MTRSLSSPVSVYMMPSSEVAEILGITRANRMATRLGARMPERSSIRVLDIWAMIRRQQMLENTVPVR